MNIFIIVLICLIIFLLIIIFIKLYDTSYLPKYQKKTINTIIPLDTTYQQNNKLPIGWNLTGTNNTSSITPIQIGGVNI